MSQKNVSAIELLQMNVNGFESLVHSRGLERGSTTLVSGGAGSGKTTFCLQSIYKSLLENKNEKAVHISTEEKVDRLKKHMLNNYGWDFYTLEEQGRMAFLELDPIQVAREVEASILREKKKLLIEFSSLEMPFKPDRIVLDSLSSLSIAFQNSEGYRKYIRHLFKKLESYNSVNLMITETEQDPKIYSRAGIEEFLVDGVIVLYNIKENATRQSAIEVLKMRSTKHMKKLVPFQINENGIQIFPKQEIFGD